MRPHAGALKHRVTVRENTPTRNDYGELVDSWSDVETVYASIEDTDGFEALRGGMDTALAEYVFRMRYRSDLGTGDTLMLNRYRLQYDSRTFRIVGVVDVDERRRWLEVMADEVVA